MLCRIAFIALELPVLHLEEATDALVLPLLSLSSSSLSLDASLSWVLLYMALICLLLSSCIAWQGMLFLLLLGACGGMMVLSK